MLLKTTQRNAMQMFDSWWGYTVGKVVSNDSFFFFYTTDSIKLNSFKGSDFQQQIAK